MGKQWVTTSCSHLTNSMELSPPCETTSRSITREFPQNLCNPKVHYFVYYRPPCSLYWAGWIQSIPPHPISARSILISKNSQTNNNQWLNFWLTVSVFITLFTRRTLWVGRQWCDGRTVCFCQVRSSWTNSIKFHVIVLSLKLYLGSFRRHLFMVYLTTPSVVQDQQRRMIVWLINNKLESTRKGATVVWFEATVIAFAWRDRLRKSTKTSVKIAGVCPGRNANRPPSEHRVQVSSLEPDLLVQRFKFVHLAEGIYIYIYI
jgi:hypothetical protein